ncbi:MAG: T9SS type A sorting domain-containing protein [Spirosomataceae bacterium]
MRRTLFLLFIATLLGSSLSAVYAQTVTEKSRLYLGKNTSKSAPKPSFELSKVKPTNISNVTTLNKYYKETLISRSSKTNSTKEVEKNTASTSEKSYTTSIYPNPANDYTFVEYKVMSRVDKVQISFFNLLGTEVESVQTDAASDKIRINTRNWPSGVYFYQLTLDDKKVSTKKFIVNH